MRRRLATIAPWWFALATTWTLAAAALVFVQHQVLRQQADEPQLQMAEDAARRIDGGAEALAILPKGEPVPLEASLAPWLAVYGAGAAPLASSARYANAAPMPPAGVFEFARTHAGHRLSWQPRSGVRQALVIVPLAKGGFVVAGRSLREVEARKQQVLELVLVGWGLGLLVLLLPALALPSRNGG